MNWCQFFRDQLRLSLELQELKGVFGNRVQAQDRLRKIQGTLDLLHVQVDDDTIRKFVITKPDQFYCDIAHCLSQSINYVNPRTIAVRNGTLNSCYLIAASHQGHMLMSVFVFIDSNFKCQFHMLVTKHPSALAAGLDVPHLALILNRYAAGLFDRRYVIIRPPSHMLDSLRDQVPDLITVIDPSTFCNLGSDQLDSFMPPDKGAITYAISITPAFTSVVFPEGVAFQIHRLQSLL